MGEQKNSNAYRAITLSASAPLVLQGIVSADIGAGSLFLLWDASVEGPLSVAPTVASTGIIIIVVTGKGTVSPVPVW